MNNKKEIEMYEKLQKFNEFIEPFSLYTTDVLWTDPHIAKNMLSHHLDPTSDIASRRPETIDGIVKWINDRFDLANKAVCDLGCGPGLYAKRMASLGAHVSGLDFSPTSIEYAIRDAADNGLSINYRIANYLHGDLYKNQDVITMIYGDICALSPDQRKNLYNRIWKNLSIGGYFIFDVFPSEIFSTLEEKTAFGHLFMDSFWSREDYFGFLKSTIYHKEKIGLDRYLIVEPDRSFEVFNWLQYFDPNEIVNEIEADGFEVTNIVNLKTGKEWTKGPNEFVVLARKR